MGKSGAELLAEIGMVPTTGPEDAPEVVADLPVPVPEVEEDYIEKRRKARARSNQVGTKKVHKTTRYYIKVTPELDELRKRMLGDCVGGMNTTRLGYGPERGTMLLKTGTFIEWRDLIQAFMAEIEKQTKPEWDIVMAIKELRLENAKQKAKEAKKKEAAK